MEPWMESGEIPLKMEAWELGHRASGRPPKGNEDNLYLLEANFSGTITYSLPWGGLSCIPH